MSSIISMESGISTVAATKTFFSISVVIFLFQKQLSDLLITELQVTIFWAGSILVLLAIFPIERAIIRLMIILFLDKGLRRNSFGFWKTINEPVWEKFLNRMIKDFYLFLSISLLFLKIKKFHPEFINLSLGSFSASTIIDIASMLFFSALFVIFFNGLYNIHLNLLDIRLSQHYLTIVKENGVLNNSLSNFYINKALPLFRRTALDSYKVIVNNLIKSIKEIEKLEKARRDKPFKLSWFDNVFTTLLEIYNIFNNNKIHYHPFFSKDTTFNLVEGEYLHSKYLLEFKHHLLKNNIQKNSISYYLGHPPEWKKLRQDELDRCEILKQDNPYIWNNINEEWIKKFHDDIKPVKENLRVICNQLLIYVEDGKKGRSFFTFITTITPFKSRLEKWFNYIQKRVNLKLNKN